MVSSLNKSSSALLRNYRSQYNFNFSKWENAGSPKPPNQLQQSPNSRTLRTKKPKSKVSNFLFLVDLALSEYSSKIYCSANPSKSPNSTANGSQFAGVNPEQSNAVSSNHGK
jgi:hypothetical protein